MLLRTLFSEIPIEWIRTCSPFLDFDAEITGVSEDTRILKEGSLFCAVCGTRFDGHTLLREAKEKGAGAALLEDSRWIPVCDDLRLPWIQTVSVQACLLPLYLAERRHPERGMTFYAVTGTNGKTSTVNLLSSIFQAAGKACAVCGTIENRIGEVRSPSVMTTPSPAAFAAFLAEARDAGADTVILEASSHALAQKRLSGLRFACGIFTGLTEDHLDYHKTEEAYFAAKRSLFEVCDRCLFCTDDAAGKKLYADPSFHQRAFCFAVSRPADFSVCETGYEETGTRFRLCEKERSYRVHVPLAGTFAASNALAAAACARLCGISVPDTVHGLAACPPVPGRLERIVAAPFSVYLDYAHTPDALQKALDSLHLFLKPGARLFVLFGCGGDREKEKRSKMGKIAAEHADIVFLSEDNSRSEDTTAILSDILKGIPEACPCTVITDRKKAIEAMLGKAKPHDVLLLAGKGHETTLTAKGETIPFSERTVVSDWMRTHVQK